MEAQNAFAGQGPVLLDIGGDIGALIVHMPGELEGVEIEIRAAGAQLGHDSGQSHADHGHGQDHAHEDHAHEDHAHRPHVAVVARPTSSGLRPSAVFGELPSGRYELYERMDGRVRLTATVVGGEVTEAHWPG